MKFRQARKPDAEWRNFSRQIGDWTEGSLLPLTVTAKGTDGDTLLFESTPVEEAEPGAFLRLGE